MKPSRQSEDGRISLHVGDCLEVMRGWPDGCVHCVVTSPPYWGLRDYGTAEWEGGDEGCDHRGPPPSSSSSTLKNDGREKFGWCDADVGAKTVQYRATCRKCGARRVDQQLGLEATPAEYLAKMVAVFGEVKRVLRDDGTLWLNMGDSYVGNAPGARDPDQWPKQSRNNHRIPGQGSAHGLKSKDLVGMPWRLAFALQADGWYLRSDIIWSKVNPMPESVTDRPTKAHEYVFLLTKNARYYYDAEAVREKGKPESQSRYAYAFSGTQGDDDVNDRRTVPEGMRDFDGGRNLRTVWTIPTHAFPEAHFATFPPKLVEPCVKAGTSQHGVCSACGAPWGRVVERGELEADEHAGKLAPHRIELDSRDVPEKGWTQEKGFMPNARRAATTTGWQPTCECHAEIVPAIVLDPFAGSGTTCMVAARHGRDYLGIELNPEYAAMARRRLAGVHDETALLDGKWKDDPEPAPELF